MIHDIPFFIHRHQAAQRQTVLPRIQGADPVGQGMGQHGDHPVHQVNAGSPLQRLHIQGAALLHIIGHIRNVHSQFIRAVAVLSHRNSIVQILRVLPVNGHHGQIPQIQTTGPVCLRDRSGHPLRLV